MYLSGDFESTGAYHKKNTEENRPLLLSEDSQLPDVLKHLICMKLNHERYTEQNLSADAIRSHAILFSMRSHTGTLLFLCEHSLAWVPSVTPELSMFIVVLRRCAQFSSAWVIPGACEASSHARLAVTGNGHGAEATKVIVMGRGS